MVKLLLKQLINFTLILYTGYLHLSLWNPLFRGSTVFTLCSCCDVEYEQLDNVCVTMTTSPFIPVD